MKSRTMMSLALACAYTWAASASAGGPHNAQGDRASGSEVETPVSVNESGTGASSGTAGSGSVGSDALAANEATEYWLIGSEDAQSGVGASASGAAGGSGSFDSSAKGPDG